MSLNLKRVIDVNFALRAGLDAAVDSHQPSSNPAGRLRNTACSCSAERRRACSRTSAGNHTNSSDAPHRPGAGLETGCTQPQHVKRPAWLHLPRAAPQPSGLAEVRKQKRLTGGGLGGGGGVAGRFSLRGGVFFKFDGGLCTPLCSKHCARHRRASPMHAAARDARRHSCSIISTLFEALHRRRSGSIQRCAALKGWTC